MSEGLLLFLIAQSLIIIGVIVSAFIKTQTDLAALRVEVATVKEDIGQLKTDHGNFGNKLDGISRHVAYLEGRANQFDNVRKPADGVK